MELKEGMTPYSKGTFDCDDMPGCLYCEEGRCVFNVATIQVQVSRACYEDLRMGEIESEADHALGLL